MSKSVVDVVEGDSGLSAGKDQGDRHACGDRIVCQPGCYSRALRPPESSVDEPAQGTEAALFAAA
jgi:hypothetical protein